MIFFANKRGMREENSKTRSCTFLSHSALQKDHRDHGDRRKAKKGPQRFL